MSKKIIPVILCGGTGTRLWPLSRKSFPKQFLPLDSEENKSLLQQTVERIKYSNKFDKPILICNEEHRFIVAEQMREIDVIPKGVILEPFNKNTAPAITLATYFSLEKEENPLLLILSSDHVIKKISKFIELIECGEKYVEENKIVTFGVIPTSPETGYGYIQSENPLNYASPRGEKILRFIEKPNLEKAKKLLSNKSFSWNSGILIFKATKIIDEINKFNPKIINSCKKAILDSKKDLDFIRINKDAYKNCPNISIDYAVMERTSSGTVLPLNVGWNDIGSWNTIWENSQKDNYGNALKGNILIKETSNSYFQSEKKLLVGIGINNLVVVETNDATLVADKSKCQEVKNIVEELSKKGMAQATENMQVFRPWGNYISLNEDKNWKVKIITVNSKQSLSLQKHNFRAEHWVVVRGEATVQIGNKEISLIENQSIYIPVGSKHRLSNKRDEPLILIEVQTGSYLGEDDIIRFEDKYGRALQNL